MKFKLFSKHELPDTTCIICGKPFHTRKRWDSAWEDSSYCSDRCRNNRKKHLLEVIQHRHHHESH